MLRRFLLLIAVCLAPLMGQAQTEDPGQQVFNSTCAACHGLDGGGGEHAPNIATDPAVQGMSQRRLISIVRYGIKDKGMPGFESTLQQDQISAVVKYLRGLGGKGTTGPLPGDAAQGKTLYFGAARCSECHSLGGEGGFLGMDLSGYGARHSPAAIRAAILDPNKNPDMRHGTVIAVTRAGKTYTGITRNEDNFTLQMQMSDGHFESFDKRDLAHLGHESKSLMPADYGEKLSAGQLDDLVKFLSLAAGPQSKSPDEDE